MAKEASLIDNVKRLGAKHAELRSQLQQTKHQLDQALRDLDALGVVPEVKMAELAQLNRMTVRKACGR